MTAPPNNARPAMTEDELLKRFGLQPRGDALDEIRALLRDSTERERVRQGAGDTEVMRLCCVQLFSAALLADVPLVWAAKSCSFDAACSIDVQLLCGAGLSETKAFLSGLDDPAAAKALARILECESSGDFDGFSPESSLESYKRYYGVST